MYKLKNRVLKLKKNLAHKFIIKDCCINKIVNKKHQLIIQTRYGGLGDHLKYSSLPELLWKQKQIKVLISNKSIFYNNAIKNFVWELNPYIEFTDKKGWYIYRPVEKGMCWDNYLHKIFELKAMAIPKIYYKPKKIAELEDKTIVDPNFGLSGNANGYNNPVFYKKITDYLKNNVANFVIIKNNQFKNELYDYITNKLNPKSYNVNSIEQLTDALFSAKNRYMLQSGSASLAAALQLKSIVINYENLGQGITGFKYETNEHICLKTD